jgi:hypothetical protein
MNILEQEDIIKGLPDAALMQEAQSPSGQVPQFLVVSEIKRRSEMRKKFQENPPQEGTIKDQVIQENMAASMPQMAMAPQMPAAMPPMPAQMPPQMPPQMPQAMPQMMSGGGQVRRMSNGGIASSGMPGAYALDPFIYGLQDALSGGLSGSQKVDRTEDRARVMSQVLGIPFEEALNSLMMSAQMNMPDYSMIAPAGAGGFQPPVDQPPKVMGETDFMGAVTDLFSGFGGDEQQVAVGSANRERRQAERGGDPALPFDLSGIFEGSGETVTRRDARDLVGETEPTVASDTVIPGARRRRRGPKPGQVESPVGESVEAVAEITTDASSPSYRGKRRAGRGAQGTGIMQGVEAGDVASTRVGRRYQSQQTREPAPAVASGTRTRRMVQEGIMPAGTLVGTTPSASSRGRRFAGRSAPTVEQEQVAGTGTRVGRRYQNQPAPVVAPPVTAPQVKTPPAVAAGSQGIPLNLGNLGAGFQSPLLPGYQQTMTSVDQLLQPDPNRTLLQSVDSTLQLADSLNFQSQPDIYRTAGAETTAGGAEGSADVQGKSDIQTQATDVAKRPELDFADLIDSYRKQGVSNALMQLGAGIASNNLAGGIAAAGEAAQQGTQAANELAMQRRITEFEAGREDLRRQQESKERELDRQFEEDQAALDRALKTDQLDIERERVASLMAKNDAEIDRLIATTDLDQASTVAQIQQAAMEIAASALKESLNLDPEEAAASYQDLFQRNMNALQQALTASGSTLQVTPTVPPNTPKTVSYSSRPKSS